MKFTTTKNNLFKALNEINKVIPLRTTLPILNCVLIKNQKQKITLIATDLEQTIISELDGKILKDGETALPCGRFLEIVSALPNEELEIETQEDNETKINSSKGVYKITGKEPSEYPAVPEREKKQEITLEGHELLEIINATLYATSKDDLKPALCGIYLNIKEKDITAVATDGHRLVKYNKKIENNNPEGSIIIPGKFFNILKNGINIKEKIIINISENHLDIKQKQNCLITRIIKESFPDFNSVIPEELNIKATIKAEDVIKGLKRVSIFSNKSTKQILIDFNQNELTISTEDKETRSSAKEHLECEYNNENITIAYNAQFLKEVLEHINSPEIEIFLSGPLTAAVFKPKKEIATAQHTALLMPLRRQK
ncbi:MAG: DNA polymerase III subunit beta [Candidatus Marinimicrobia bacterium]|nr:DNA polymerase III subunit beta [Candidatus Neomarinimicrobiota bacterium]